MIVPVTMCSVSLFTVATKTRLNELEDFFKESILKH